MGCSGYGMCDDRLELSKNPPGTQYVLSILFFSVSVQLTVIPLFNSHSQSRPIVIPSLQFSLAARRLRSPCHFLFLAYMRLCRTRAPAALKTSPVPDFLNQGLLGLECDMGHAGKH